MSIETPQEMIYKGYIGSKNYDMMSDTLWGKIENTVDLVTYESLDGSDKSLYEQFVIAVDEYIADITED